MLSPWVFEWLKILHRGHPERCQDKKWSSHRGVPDWLAWHPCSCQHLLICKDLNQDDWQNWKSFESYEIHMDSDTEVSAVSFSCQAIWQKKTAISNLKHHFVEKNPKKIEKWNPTKMLSESLSTFLWVPRVPMYTFHPRKRRRCLQDLCGDSEFGEMCHGARRFGAIIWSTHYHAAWFRADSQWSDLGQHGPALQHWEPEQMGNCHFYDGRRGVIDL